MLKAKQHTSYSSKKDSAMKAVVKEDCDTQLNNRVPRRLYKKLKKYLAENEIRQQDWLIDILENL